MKLLVDGQETTVPKGTMILDAARTLGIHIPTLCHWNPHGATVSAPSTSCLVCLVKADGKMVPACATKAVDGMIIESETPEVQALRRTSLELLLSDHVGDCHAPCQFACPAKMDIPKMIREIRRKDFESAIRTIKETIAFPAVLGRVCPRPCEKICRRNGLDESVTICQLKRFVADTDLGRNQAYAPPVLPESGRSIAIIGAGASGLSAAYYLAVKGHAVTVFERGPEPGGRLLNYGEDELPRDVLEIEIGHVLSFPIKIEFDRNIPWSESGELDKLLQTYDIVLLACGPTDAQTAASAGLEFDKRGLAVPQNSFATSKDNLFASGTIIRPTAMLIRSVADGHDVAVQIDEYLGSKHLGAVVQPYSIRMKKPSAGEISELAPNSLASPRREPTDAGTDEYSEDAAMAQAARCLHCDCRGREKCRLLKHSARLGARTDRFADETANPMIIRRSGNIIFEPEKCIRCGLCITISEKAGEPLGLTFIGRGFDVRIGVPFDQSLQQALASAAEQCVDACPTAALSLDRD